MLADASFDLHRTLSKQENCAWKTTRVNIFGPMEVLSGA